MPPVEVDRSALAEATVEPQQDDPPVESLPRQQNGLVAGIAGLHAKFRPLIDIRIVRRLAAHLPAGEVRQPAMPRPPARVVRIEDVGPRCRPERIADRYNLAAAPALVDIGLPQRRAAG